MAFEFEKLSPEAKRAAFAAMDRKSGGRRKPGGGNAAAKTSSSAAASSGQQKAAGPASPADQVATAAAKLAKSPDSWVGIIDLRRELSGMDRAEQDAALKELSRTGRAVIAPESNRKVLTAADHAAAVRIGGEDNHILMMRPPPAAAGAPGPSRTAAARMDTGSRLPKLKGTSERAQVVNPAPGGGFQVEGTISRERAAEMMFGTRGAAKRIRKANAKRR